jgi:hypothetical protein
MREVAPGDVIFSFVDTRICVIGSRRILLLGKAQTNRIRNGRQNWENIEWRVAVRFRALKNRIRPNDHIQLLRPLLPKKFATATGENGLLLAPSIDHCFDRGLIGFEGDGSLIMSPSQTVHRCSAWVSSRSGLSSRKLHGRTEAVPRFSQQFCTASDEALESPAMVHCT